MIIEEAEYKKAFMLHKRWAKHWLTNSAHRAHSSTIGMIEPATKTLRFIESIDNKDISFKTKFELLDRFLADQENCEKNNKRMGSDYYFECLQYNEKVINNITMGVPVNIPKMPRS